MIKKYIKGNEERASEVIKELEKLGAIDSLGYSGDNENMYYWVGKDNAIKECHINSSMAEVLEELFEEIKLPKPKLKVIRGDKKRGSEILELLISIGGDNQKPCNGTDKTCYYFVDDKGCIDCRTIHCGFFKDYDLEILELKPSINYKLIERKCEN